MLVYVDLPRDEEEVIAYAVEKNAGVQHPRVAACVPRGKEQIPYRPRRHTNEEDPFYPDADEKPRKQDHEPQLRRLPKRHLARRFRESDLVQVQVRERVVELQRNAEEKRADHEHGERSVAEQRQSVEPDDITGPERLTGGVRRCVWQHHGEDAERERRAGRQTQRNRRGLESQSPNE